MGKDLFKILAGNLSRIRSEKGLTQVNMAKLVNVSVRFYQGLEWGEENPTVEVLQDIVRGANVPLMDLFEDPRSKPPEDQAREYLLKSYQEVQKENEQLRSLFSKVPRGWTERLVAKSPEDFGAVAARAFLANDPSVLKALPLPAKTRDLLKKLMAKNE